MMILLKGKFLRQSTFHLHIRCAVQYEKIPSVINRSVIISQSTDIYTNLALEDWIYKYSELNDRQILMLWRSSPCVVIGRHQNPWLEVNLQSIKESGIKLARRHSGGGAVYQDLGNLNLTFFTTRDHYNRKSNLKFISKILLKRYGIQADISDREDLLVDKCKISGTAAKLGRDRAYHHCTLLLAVNKENLNKMLCADKLPIKTIATSSSKSAIINLSEKSNFISIDDMVSALSCEFINSSLLDNNQIDQRCIQTVYPDNKCYLGITELRTSLESWEWCYGRTPKFSLSKVLNVSLFHSTTNNFQHKLPVTLVIENGKVNDVYFSLPLGTRVDYETNVTNLKGQKFTNDIIYDL